MIQQVAKSDGSLCRWVYISQIKHIFGLKFLAHSTNKFTRLFKIYL